MSTTIKLNTRYAEALHLQSIEGNPLNADQIAMFQMFEKENWSQEKRLAYIKERASAASRR